MKEQTDSHRRCTKCREWKWKHEYPLSRKWLAWECRECKTTRMSLWRYNKGDAYMAAHYAQSQKNARKRHQKVLDEREDAAEMYVSLLRDRGWTISRIAEETGLCRNTVSWAGRRHNNYVHKQTVTKLRDAFMQEVART